ncbi:MAG: hypothetical protein IKK63_07925 [Clostridia bacterium]|nr:hypothetical protein [Clostridia bacterium]
MKKTGTKVLSVIMAILCLIPMLSISSFAAEEEIGQVIVAAGQAITDSGYWRINVLGNVTSGSEKNYNIAYDKESNTLTLKDAEFENKGIGVLENIDFDMATGIVSTQDLNIRLIGKNTINIKNTRNGEATGIFNVYGSTYFSGDGSLTINSNTPDAICSAIVAGQGEIHITETAVSINITDCSDEGTCALIANKIYVHNSDLNINAVNSEKFMAVYSGTQGSLFEAVESDVNITVENCKNAYGLYIFSVTIKDSNANIEINNKDIKDFDSACQGISTGTLLIQNSYVDIVIISYSDWGYTSAMNYMIAVIDGFTDRQNISLYKYLTRLSITPEGITEGVTIINAGLHGVYSAGDNEDYYWVFDTKNNSGHTTEADGDWNVHYDRITNTLYLRSFTENDALEINGFVNIHIEGDNSFSRDEHSFGNVYGLESKYAPEITGNGTLTFSSVNATAIKNSKGIILGENVTAKGSFSPDGSDAEDYDNAKATQYKWVQITAATEEEQKELSFFEKIAEFFRNIFAKIGEFFGGLFG